jgi:hypothetical protein
LTAIANRFKTKVHSIALANKIVDVHYIPAGKLLLIPLQSIKSDQVTKTPFYHAVIFLSCTGLKCGLMHVFRTDK